MAILTQPHHAGRQTTRVYTEGRQPVSASDVPCKMTRSQPRPLTIKEIEELVEKFSDGSRRAKDAGFDAVEIHGAHGYLVSQFMSPYTNKRTDRYGGDFENRMRFPLEIIERTREKVGYDFPILFRMNGDEYVEGGLKLQDTKRIAKKLEEASVDAVDVTAGIAETRVWQIQPAAIPHGVNVHLAQGIKESVNIPVIIVGRINDPELANKIIQEGKADLVAMGRALITDPELAKKAAEGRNEDIRKCIACLRGCLGRIFAHRRMSCTVNAAVGKEKEYAIIPAPKPKKVLVVGGGPAGMEAARVLALRKHHVTLYEKTKKLDICRWHTASLLPVVEST